MKIKIKPKLDPNFFPLAVCLKNYLEEVKTSTDTSPFGICIGYGPNIYRYDLQVFEPKDATFDRTIQLLERLTKSLLWAIGGATIILGGNEKYSEVLKALFTKCGKRKFDVEIMEKVFQQDFEVRICSFEELPQGFIKPLKPIGGHWNGCRIGFDAGGSDYKVCAVQEGNVLYSEEVSWEPKIASDPSYHYEKIVSSFKKAKGYLPRVDAIGISSAGIYINNQVRIASLFIKVPEEVFENEVPDIFLRAGHAIGVNNLVVVNDGDVTALAGAIELKEPCVLGIAMGTSEAAGYVNQEGTLTGWLNELAFVPVDANIDAPIDEWSGDYGCGVKYLSQDAVIRLARAAGIELPKAVSKADQLKVVQELLAKGNQEVVPIYETIGIYLGYSLLYYLEFYDFKHVLLLGRVMSGAGGDIIAQFAKQVLDAEILNHNIMLHLPDEMNRRLGQSIIASSLPEV